MALLSGLRRGMTPMSSRLELSLLRGSHFERRAKQITIRRPIVNMKSYALVSGCGISYLITRKSSECAATANISNGNSDESSAPDSPSAPNPFHYFKDLLAKYSEHISQLGLSGLLGICSGVALKHAGRKVAIVIGGVFVVLQGLHYLGYIHIDYNKATQDATNLLDLDQDGKLTEKDIQVAMDKVASVLATGVESAGSFAGGMALGIYFS